MSFDRGDSHFEDAGTWEKACRHIALFLWWAAERGLGGEDHTDLKTIRREPTAYFIGACDCKLWDEDFNAEGVAFAEARYSDYCGEVERYARKLKVSDYAIPENATTAKYFFAYLDNKLAAWRKKTAKPAKKGKPKPTNVTKAKIKTQPTKSKQKPKKKANKKS